MMMGKKINKFLLSIFIVFGALTPLSLPATNLHCHLSATKNDISPEKRARIEARHKSYSQYFPSSVEEWTRTYESFGNIVKYDKYFYRRIKAATKKAGRSMSPKDYKALLNFEDAQNTRFMNKNGRTEVENKIFFSIESSYLKQLNDEAWGKEPATSSNHFIKLLMITRMFEVAADSKYGSNADLVNYLYENLVIHEVEKSSEKHNDFKIYILELPTNRGFKRKRIQNLLKTAYRTGKEEYVLFFERELAELEKLRKEKLPSHMQLSFLYNGLSADQVWQILAGLKESRYLDDPFELLDFNHGKDKILRRKEESFRYYYSYEKLVSQLLLSDKSVANISSTGVLYPSPMIFKLLRKLAPKNNTKRKDRNEKENKIYEARIRYLINKRFENLRLSDEEVRDLVQYFHALSHLVPAMAFERNDPLQPNFTGNAYLMSFDLVNGGGIELSKVAEALTKTAGGSIIEKILAAKEGVDKTTDLMNVWSSTIKRTIREAAAKQGITVEVQRSGDDVLAVFSRIPNAEEISYLLAELKKVPQIVDLSRITHGLFNISEAVIDRVTDLENIEKRIEKEYYLFGGPGIPAMPRFSVERITKEKYRLNFLQKNIKDQRDLIRMIIQDNPDLKELNIEIEGEKPEDFHFSASAAIPILNLYCA